MPDVSLPAVLVAAIVAFVLSGAWYAALGARLSAAQGASAADQTMPPWKVAAELLRSLVLAAVLAGFASHADVETIASGLVLGLVLWIAFPFVLWTGAIVHEGTPWRLAAIHAGDWLVKLPVIAVIVSVWQ